VEVPESETIEEKAKEESKRKEWSETHLERNSFIFVVIFFASKHVYVQPN